MGTELLKRLLQVGCDEDLTLISAEILAENSAMQKVCKHLTLISAEILTQIIVNCVSVAGRSPLRIGITSLSTPISFASPAACDRIFSRVRWQSNEHHSP
ncbi:hypothetical protein [Nostoc sp. CCY 9925]|uniref:hypothetical protein n=1 Tax=Nostoc sp. CCY 9925 TaxID=3103865 RepID=UPI0039C5FB33